MTAYVLFDTVNGDYVASDAPGDGERFVCISTCVRLCDAEREAVERNGEIFPIEPTALDINRGTLQETVEFLDWYLP